MSARPLPREAARPVIVASRPSEAIRLKGRMRRQKLWRVSRRWSLALAVVELAVLAVAMAHLERIQRLCFAPAAMAAPLLWLLAGAPVVSLRTLLRAEERVEVRDDRLRVTTRWWLAVDCHGVELEVELDRGIDEARVRRLVDDLRRTLAAIRATPRPLRAPPAPTPRMEKWGAPSRRLPDPSPEE